MPTPKLKSIIETLPVFLATKGITVYNVPIKGMLYELFRCGNVYVLECLYWDVQLPLYRIFSVQKNCAYLQCLVQRFI